MKYTVHINTITLQRERSIIRKFKLDRIYYRYLLAEEFIEHPPPAHELSLGGEVASPLSVVTIYCRSVYDSSPAYFPVSSFRVSAEAVLVEDTLVRILVSPGTTRDISVIGWSKEWLRNHSKF